ncbi:MAG TPA: SAM-dependent methyltransferase [Acidimicrobiales bacterium]
MTEQQRSASAEAGQAFPEIDSTVAHAARVYDYMLGGDDNFEVDRIAAEAAAAVVGGMENVRSEVRANRAFLGRAVRFVAGEGGVRQFLDIGTGIPNENNVHAVAQATAPDCRVVYVDNDPIVLAHAHALLEGTDEGATVYLQDDLRQPDSILRRAAEVLDFAQPVAVMLVGLLHHFRDEDDPYSLVARLVDAVAPGSYLVVSHMAIDIMPDLMARAAEQLDAAMEEPFIPRPHAAVARFFDGLVLVEPGVVQVDQWRPDGPVAAREGWTNPLYVGVARKP